jgi:2-polyprenyl-3-methyl-5-hydroxy-6-metoxy-1,4-benzoquinol methylase
MYDRSTRIHSVEKAGTSESLFRYRAQNPEKIVRPYIEPGMTVLDLGCGPGFFTTEIACLIAQVKLLQPIYKMVCLKK